jgi:hypothetical protein
MLSRFENRETSVMSGMRESKNVCDSFQYIPLDSFKIHPLFSRFNDALSLNVYVDGFETTNPLGSRTQIHKLEGLYMTVRNIPFQYSSKLLLYWLHSGMRRL